MGLDLIAVATKSTFNPLYLLAIPVILALILGRKKKGKKPGAAATFHGMYLGPIVHNANYTDPSVDLVSMANGCKFTFPGKGPGVHALVWPNCPSLKGKSEIIVRFRVTGGGFVPTRYGTSDVSPVARVGLMIQRHGDNWAGTGATEFHRMYFKGGIPLADGTFELRASLKELTQWKPPVGAYGGMGQAAFDANLANIGSLQVIFGSDGGQAKGVFSKESAQFELLGLPEIR